MAGTDDGVITSVIIPVYNDPEGLRRTVESLLKQTADEYEVIIADNGSTDQTRLFAKQYATRDRVRRVVEDETQSSYAARNAGIDAAKGNILAFVDADMWVENDWVKSVQHRVRNNNIDYMGCHVEIVAESETIWAQYNQAIGFRVRRYIEKKNFAPTCCLVVQRHVIEKVGPFDKRLISSGDLEFGHRVHNAGIQQEFVSDIKMYHPARESFRELAAKKYRIGRGNTQRASYHPGMFNLRHPLNPLQYLPVQPSIILEASENEPVHRTCLFFLMAYILKLIQTAGSFHERIAPKKV